MALINSYGIWNNKGGVGKSTITYHLASRYAELHPEQIVLVLDLCPQANSSMMFLGGGQVGENNVVQLCSEATPRTVVGYLTTVITNGPAAALPDYDQFLINVHDYNSNLPENLILLSGDGNLEPIAPEISNRANDRPLSPASNPWIWIHNIFKNLIIDFSVRIEKDLMVFIDTNPSFGIYTELAITSSLRLICPVNADDSSRTAANALTILLHGTNPPHAIYGSWTFAAIASGHGTTIPKIHLIVGNRLTQYIGAASAFNAMSEATAQTLYTIYQNNPDYFTAPQMNITNLEDFKECFSIPLRDFNTAGVVTSHLGKRLSQMSSGYYPVYGQTAKINKERVVECLNAIDEIIQRL